jgi:hypothetical protein
MRGEEDSQRMPPPKPMLPLETVIPESTAALVSPLVNMKPRAPGSPPQSMTVASGPCSLRTVIALPRKSRLMLGNVYLPSAMRTVSPGRAASMAHWMNGKSAGTRITSARARRGIKAVRAKLKKRS